MGVVVVAYTGVQNLMKCPKQPKIPLYLFVFGSFGLVKVFQNLYDQWRMRRIYKFDDEVADDEEGVGSRNDSGLSFIDIALTTFLLIWFGFGNYWVK
jgi:hypothetical protein